jgi:DNA-binding GntR family transcriptional regulator
MPERQTIIDRNPHELPQTRADWATARLRSAILFAEIVPGAEIRETVLAKRWGISPTPLREALRRLAAEGLVTQQPQRIARAAELSREQCIELYELRLVLEVLAIRLSLANRPADRIAQAESLLDQMGEVEASTPFDPIGYERVHREFHDVLVCDCGSATLLDMLSSLWDRSMRFRYAAQSTATIPGALVKQHRKLLRSWKAGDARKATLGIEEHILSVLTEVLSPEEIERVRRMRSGIPAMGRDLVASGLVSDPVGEIVAVGTLDVSSDN